MTLEPSDQAKLEQAFGDRHEAVAAAIAGGDDLDETDQARLETAFGDRAVHIGAALRGELDGETKKSTSKSTKE